MLDLNITFWIQLANFFLALFLLNLLLIRPIREIIKKRNAMFDDIARTADGFHSEAVARLQKYEDELAKARKEAGESREGSKNEALAEMRKIVDSAQRSAMQVLEENRAALRGQTEQALSELRDGIDNFSTRLGKKLLGEEN